MDRNIRRVLYTALVAGGLVVVGASSAHAAGEGRPEPATQGPTETVEGSAARGEDDVAVDDVAVDAHEPAAGAALGTGLSAGTGAEGVAGDPARAVEDADSRLVGDIVGPDGILGSLTEGDVAGVVDGALGAHGLVGDLLDLPGTEAPGPGHPGGDEPGTDEPGTDEPGTDEPGTDEPGRDEPGTDPGAGGPGTGPGTVEPGTDEPGTDQPGTDAPGTGGTGRPDAGRPGADGAGPGTGTDRPGTDRPGTRPGTGGAGSAGDHGAERPGRVPLTDTVPGGLGSSAPAVGRPDLASPSVHVPSADGAADSSAEGSDADRSRSEEGVDISWGDKEPVDREDYDGSILYGDLGDLGGSLSTTVDEPEPEDRTEAERVLVPGATPVQAGHMFTGQLSLISLLLGLGIAVLRVRRR